MAQRALTAAFSMQGPAGATSETLSWSNASHASRLLPDPARLEQSLHETPYDLNRFVREAPFKKGTVLYLAYGSNLSNETFKGNRGIRPLSQVNVQAPTLRLTFDLPGMPYVEPCFANTALRDPNNDPPSVKKLEHLEPLREGYRKDNWHKGLIGVVYEVTPEDYAHIIATEGGGSGYQDILVDCHPLAGTDPTAPVPQFPEPSAFKAHTLFAPAVPPGEQPPSDGGRFQRPDTSYAQASARYLKLITDGAAELELPYEYQDYLHSLRPYTITTNKQRMGQFIFLAVWMPVIQLLFVLSGQLAGEDGQLPRWMRTLMAAVFRAVWVSYDDLFKPLFGDGERTIGEDDADSAGGAKMRLARVGDGDIEKGEVQSSR